VSALKVSTFNNLGPELMGCFAQLLSGRLLHVHRIMCDITPGGTCEHAIQRVQVPGGFTCVCTSDNPA
jgi:hypothetical protein